MKYVILTALGVGGATVLGALIGFGFKKVSHKQNDAVLGFAAGVMLAAAILGLIIPSLESGGDFALPISIAGVICGALFLNLMDRALPHLHSLAGTKPEIGSKTAERMDKVLLFVLAIALHNLPEGLAAGVGFGTGDNSAALTVAFGIALQNIPEGMVIIAPMLASGISKKRTLIIALSTGFIEVIGTFLGYFASQIAEMLLPFLLAFAGGTMLYIISDEMIPETHSHGHERIATYSLLIGFLVILSMDYLM